MPLGDRRDPDLRNAAFRQAKFLSGEILDREEAVGNKVMASISLIDRFPWESPLTFIRRPVTKMEGYVIEFREIK